MKRKGVLALALALAATLSIGVAVALAAHKYRTKIDFLGNSTKSSDVTFYGNLKSNSKCLDARKVGLFRQTSGGDYRLLDVDLSSINGAWALRTEINGSPTLTIVVTKDKRKRGKVVCKSATLELHPTPAGAFRAG